MLKNWILKTLCIGLIGSVIFAMPKLRQVQGAQIDQLIKKMEKTNGTAKDKLSKFMEQAARKIGISILPHLAVASRDDGLLVATPIAGVENLRMEALERGADTMFLYLNLPPQAGIPNGFYTVNVRKHPQTGEWIGTLLDSFGIEAGTFDSVEVGEVEIIPPPPGEEGAKVDGLSVYFDDWPKEADKKRAKLHHHSAIYENRPPLEPLHTRTWVWYTKEVR